MHRLKTILLLTTISSCLLALSGCMTPSCYGGFPEAPASLMQEPREQKPILEDGIDRPVTLRQFMGRVGENMEACHLNADDYRALQDWVRQQKEK